jgi:hypothetical protein
MARPARMEKLATRKRILREGSGLAAVESLMVSTLCYFPRAAVPL